MEGNVDSYFSPNNAFIPISRYPWKFLWGRKYTKANGIKATGIKTISLYFFSNNPTNAKREIIIAIAPQDGGWDITRNISIKKIRINLEFPFKVTIHRQNKAKNKPKATGTKKDGPRNLTVGGTKAIKNGERQPNN